MSYTVLSVLDMLDVVRMYRRNDKHWVKFVQKWFKYWIVIRMSSILTLCNSEQLQQLQRKICWCRSNVKIISGRPKLCSASKKAKITYCGDDHVLQLFVDIFLIIQHKSGTVVDCMCTLQGSHQPSAAYSPSGRWDTSAVPHLNLHGRPQSFAKLVSY